MMRGLFLSIVLLASANIFAGAVTATGLDRDLVPDATTATRIGAAILEAWMGKAQFAVMTKRAPLRAVLNGDTWSVFAYRPERGHTENQPNGETSVTVTTGGGEPVIELSRHDAQVKRIYFAR